MKRLVFVALLVLLPTVAFAERTWFILPVIIFGNDGEITGGGHSGRLPHEGRM